MADVALSAGPSSLAALLSGASPDSPAATATASQGSDPFAALLASATAIKNGDAPAGTKTPDAVAILLAGAAPVAAAPVATAPIAVTTKAQAAAALPIATEALPIESDAAPSTAPAKTRTKAEDDDPDADSNSKNDGGDPLADAIASGATAVLAFVPAIIPPMQAQAQDVPPTQTPVGIDAPVASRPLKLAPASFGPPHGRPAAVDTQSQGDQAAATRDPMNSDTAQADGQTPQQAPATDAKRATVQLSPEVAKAVVAALSQKEANPMAVAQSGAASGPTATDTTKIQLQQEPQQPPQAAVQQAQHQAAPVQTSQARRRNEEVAAPRRAGDTRKRVDITPTDAASAGLPSRAFDTAQPTISRAVTDVHAKGDTIVEQTLTVARDGAWLDKLAHDIASAGSGNDLHFKLEPQNLGALSVAIRQGDDGASIRLTADNQTTRDMLVDAQPKLVAEARAQGLKVSDTQIDVRQDHNHSQNQSSGQDAQRWAQNQSGQNGGSQNGQNRQSSPGHQPFVSNLARKAEADPESPDRDSDARYA